MKKNSGIIRRKFLLLEHPSPFAAAKQMEIEQGYLAHSSARDLRIRRKDKSHFLSFRENISSSWEHQEIPLTKAKFEALWPFTEGQRIELNRSFVSMKGLKIKIDSFLGEHAPLKLAEVFFGTAAASKTFEKPDFLGEEVTRQEEYQTAFMALHGAPEPMGMCQVGILPYIFRDKKLHVLLITSSSGNRWILPKGRQEPDMTPHEVAIMEAVEEGGVLGTLRYDLRVRCRMTNGRSLQLYPMKISKLLGTWPEENFRLRRLMPINDALQMIEDPEIVRAMRRLATQLKKQGS